jgi:phosphoinositide-3-kinase regulatory subunit 4
VSVVKCESQDKQFNKVTTLKALEQTDSFLVGTNTGLIQLYKMDHTAYREGKNLGVSQLRTFRKANSEIKKIESMSNDMSEAIFVYVTSMGEIVVEDIRSRSPAIQFSVGKERGLVTSMIQRSNSLSTCISTMNGYCVVYDLRCNLISNVFQLLSPEDQPLPIFSMANFKRVTALEGVEPVDMIGLGFQSNNNEVGFWNFNDLNENINPCLYLVCSDKKDIIIQNPRLKSLYKIEQVPDTISLPLVQEFLEHTRGPLLVRFRGEPPTTRPDRVP